MKPAAIVSTRAGGKEEGRLPKFLSTMRWTKRQLDAQLRVFQVDESSAATKQEKHL